MTTVCLVNSVKGEYQPVMAAWGSAGTESASSDSWTGYVTPICFSVSSKSLGSFLHCKFGYHCSCLLYQLKGNFGAVPLLFMFVRPCLAEHGIFYCSASFMRVINEWWCKRDLELLVETPLLLQKTFGIYFTKIYLQWKGLNSTSSDLLNTFV
jgi:hypothetical protein